eukprot:365235-Chlamydomonas_euryale.AAC.9
MQRQKRTQSRSANKNACLPPLNPKPSTLNPKPPSPPKSSRGCAVPQWADWCGTNVCIWLIGVTQACTSADRRDTDVRMGSCPAVMVLCAAQACGARAPPARGGDAASGVARSRSAVGLRGGARHGGGAASGVAFACGPGCIPYGAEGARCDAAAGASPICLTSRMRALPPPHD